MYAKQPDIASLISSRICHDLVSPLGAITNGLELMELSGVTDGPEYGLLNDSVANATARISFFRYAYGGRGYGDSASAKALQTVLADFYSGTRITAHWHAVGDVPRVQAKLALLLIQCLETFLPTGGEITATCTGRDWRLAATGPQLRPDAANLTHLLNQTLRGDLKASEIQFELARALMADDNVPLTVEPDAASFVLSYQMSAA